MTESPSAASLSFRAKYEAAVARNDSLLCVGLDPDPKQIPPGVGVVDFLRGVIEATADLVCCYKPNAAFFEPAGAEGWEQLHEVIALIPSDIPVLLDAKRGDVGNTSQFYARAVFEGLGADAVTANPYLGSDGLEPFLAFEQRHTFVLCRTSNPGARELQDQRLADGRLLYEHVAALANDWNTRGNVGLVVGATYPEEAARIRAICPDMLFLMPGVGAQAGDLEAAVRASVDADGGGILVNASRSVLYAGSPEDSRAEATRLRRAMNLARRS
ncbi:MAG: orotidine-5'-phosphate decarboxylase [Chloroflexi bacterium]|nr:MAG: orotidine-5'-phosphate decarboxylase [Chloroflexota bacterium]